MEDKIIEILKEALGTENINSETSKLNCEEWDSFNHLVVISELERVLDVEFTIEETEHMDSVQDIVKIMENR